MAQKYTEARRDGNRRWDAAHLDRISIALPKGTKDDIKAHAVLQGESVNAFIRRAIEETIHRDSSASECKLLLTPIAKQIADMVNTLSESDQAFSLLLIKKLVRASES